MIRKLLIIALAFVTLAAVALLLAHPARTRGEVSFTTETPSVAPAEGMTIRDRVKITRVHHHIRFTRIASRAPGPCYRIDAVVIGDNPLIDDIVTGTGHFHWCVDGQHPNQLVDKNSYSNSDHSESWGWELANIELTSGRGWSNTWCLDPGETGPCFPVQYRYWRYTFRWTRLIGVFGQGITLHKTLYAGCTVRGNPGGFHCGTGDVT